MAQNTNPIYSLTPNVNAGQLTPSITANTKSDGAGTIGTDIVKCFTAGANGSYVSSIRIAPYAIVAATATTITTLRIFISNKTSGATTLADTWLFYETTAASVSADHSTAALTPIEIPVNRSLPAAYTILITQHIVAAANTGYQVTVFGGDY